MQIQLARLFTTGKTNATGPATTYRELLTFHKHVVQCIGRPACLCTSNGLSRGDSQHLLPTATLTMSAATSIQMRWNQTNPLGNKYTSVQPVLKPGENRIRINHNSD